MYMYYIFIDSCKDVVSAADDGRDTSRTRNHDLYSTSNFHVSREYVRPACTKTCTYSCIPLNDLSLILFFTPEFLL